MELGGVHQKAAGWGHRVGWRLSPDAYVSPHSDRDVSVHSIPADCSKAEGCLHGLAVLLGCAAWWWGRGQMRC